MTILYFAWVRDGIGLDQEPAPVPDHVHRVDALLDWLCTLSERHRNTLLDRERLRIAVNQDMADWDSSIEPGDEIAIFPPVTGG